MERTEIFKIKIVTTLIATITAIIFIILVNMIPDKASVFLSIEVILLPSVYAVGSVFLEHQMKKDYEFRMNKLSNIIKELNRKYYKAKYIKVKQ